MGKKPRTKTKQIRLSLGRKQFHDLLRKASQPIKKSEARKAIVGKEIIPSPGHEPGLLPVWLAEQGVSVIIASGMGSRAQNLFKQNRIKVIIGALEADPEGAVLSYMSGTLATEDNICDH